MKHQSKRFGLWIYMLVVLVLYVPSTQAKIKGFAEVQTIVKDHETLHQYKHLSSGFNVMWIENEDQNRSFTLGIKTPTKDSTGVNHIIEHTVLKGSQKYPSKDVFFEVAAQYPTHFMNAMTSADCTLYPFCTAYQEAYDVLFDVYMDAIFNPKMLEQPYTFYEESFHYNPQTDQIGGVVYHEMKGANAQEERRLYMALREGLYEQTHYANDSGGDPKEIPTLSYEQFIKTYQDYYYPNNMLLVLYGDLPIKQLLSQADAYVKDYTLTDKWVNVNVPFTETTCPLEITHESEDKNISIIKGFLLKEEKTLEEALALDLWIQTYWEDAQSPLRLYLKEKGITGVRVVKDEGTRYPLYGLIVTDIPEQNKESVSQLLDEAWEATLSKQDKEKEEANLEAYTFNQATKTKQAQRGIGFSERLIEAFVHEQPKEYALYDASEQATLELTYTPEVIEHIFEEEMQKRTIYLTPTPPQVYRAVAASTHTPTEWETIAQNMLAYKEQAEASPQPLPTMNPKQMLKKVDFPVCDKQEKITYLCTPVEEAFYQTKLYLPVGHVPQEKLPYLFLYEKLLNAAAVQQMPFIGKASIDLVSVDTEETTKHYLEWTLITREIEEAITLYQTVQTEAANQSLEWYQEVIIDAMRGFENACERDILGTLKRLNASSQSGAKRYQYERTYPHYKWLAGLDVACEQTIQEALELGASIGFNEASYIGLAAPKKSFKACKNLWNEVVLDNQIACTEPISYAFEKGHARKKYYQETPVDYVVYTYDQEKEFVTGADYMMAAYVTQQYLHPTIRVEKGAYGTGMYAIYPNTLFLYTYRDPDYRSTLECMNQIGCLLDQEVSDEKIKSLSVEALSQFQKQLGLVAAKQDQAKVFEKLILAGANKDTIDIFQRTILNTSKENLYQRIKRLEELLPKSQIGVCTQKKLPQETNQTQNQINQTQNIEMRK